MHRILVVGGGNGREVARLLLEAAKASSLSAGTVILANGHAEGDAEVLVRDDNGQIEVSTLNADDLQVLCALRAPTMFPDTLTLEARPTIKEFTWVLPEMTWESTAERKARWQQSSKASNRKFQSMQAKARRR